MFRNWHVLTNKQGKHHYFYGDLYEYEDEDLVGLTEIEEQDFSSDDIMYLLDEIYGKKYMVSALLKNMLPIISNTVTITEEEKKQIALNIKNLADIYF